MATVEQVRDAIAHTLARWPVGSLGESAEPGAARDPQRELKGDIMALTVKVITLWRREIENRPGALASVLHPLATTKADLQVLMAYRFPGDENRGAVELFPISGRKAIAAASDAGLTPAADIPAVLVQGSNRSGIGYQASRAIADEGINLAFLVAQVVGTKFSAVYGFDTVTDRDRAVKLLKKGRR